MGIFGFFGGSKNKGETKEQPLKSGAKKPFASEKDFRQKMFAAGFNYPGQVDLLVEKVYSPCRNFRDEKTFITFFYKLVSYVKKKNLKRSGGAPLVGRNDLDKFKMAFGG